ncbi:MAG TPA: DUF72 domain-containing protein [Blastocatellia bacterium]|nr:DUF72 domain-containing protein [Blastocatellia bacterium]
MAASIFLGTQGWNYEGWVGPFYPRGSKAKELLSLYANIFDSVEVDSSFYAIPSENSIKGWAERTPKSFKFSLKLPSEITHKNRLRDSQAILEQFMQRISLLGDKLGCVLIQLPPDFSPNEHAALRNFIDQLPPEARFAVEFRDANWLNDATVELLARRNIALALTDSRWIHRTLSFRIIDSYPADFAYVRWLGPRELTDYSRIQIDRSREMAQWADAFAALKEKVSCVFGYFNNHFQGHSPASCNQFKELLGLPVTRPDALVKQPSLF